MPNVDAREEPLAAPSDNLHDVTARTGFAMRPDSIVTVDLMGGLGNQLFQYAAGHALARRTGATLRLDLSHYARFHKRSYLLDCYAVPAPISQDPWPLRWRGLPHSLAVKTGRRLGLSTRALQDGWNVYTQPGMPFDPAFEQLEPPVHLHGYFQSELFFMSVADEIRDLFTIRVPTSPAYAAARAQIAAAEWPVSIHVRRGDYSSDPKLLNEVNGIFGASYYRAAISIVEHMSAKRPTYFVVSDEIGAARELLGSAENFVYLSDQVDRPWEDLALMAACRGHIIANSTFSWWGAWLDPSPDKLVIAPRQWFALPLMRKVSTADLFCPGWMTI
jgi:hypothetical protein